MYLFTYNKLTASERDGSQGFDEASAAKQFRDNDNAGDKNSEKFQFIYQLQFRQLVGIHERGGLSAGRGRR